MSSTSRHLRPGRLVARLLALTGLVLAMGVTGLATADISTAAACTSSSGVTVVVDYGSLGGTSVGCASSTGSGIDMLEATGHTVTYVSPRQPGFVCTIDRLPDPCNGAPSTAYWSYWHAEPGGTWSYSTLGAASTRPKSGTVEGWAFGAGKPPAMRPPSRPRPASSTTSASRTTTSRPASTGAAGSSGGSATRATTPARTAPAKTTATTTASPTASATTAPSPSAEPSTDAPTAARTDAAAPTSATSSSGGTGTLVVAALLVLLLAGGGGVLAWRRRGRDA